MDHFNGYQGAVNHAALNNTGNRLMAQSHPQLSDVYGGPNGLYPMPQVQPSFGQGPLPPSPHHSLPGQAIDGYVLQGNSGHNQGISPSHPLGGGFSGGSFPFPTPGAMNDPYQRSNFGYGM